MTMDVLSDFQPDMQELPPNPKLGTTRAGKGFSKYIGEDEVGRLILPSHFSLNSLDLLAQIFGYISAIIVLQYFTK